MPTFASGEPGGERPVPGGFDVVTGAFSHSGAAIARGLLAAGRPVRTVTGHPGRAPVARRSRSANSTSPTRLG